MNIPKPIIIDISEWQEPKNINYDVLAKNVSGVIVRVQYGSNYIDKHYKTHINEFKKRGIPIAVYAWVRGSSYSDMEVEANDFYQRAKEFKPIFWWLDIEEQSMSDMRGGCEKYRQKLKSLGVEKVCCYIANHLYQVFNIDVAKFDGLWIPTYGRNNGLYEGSIPTSTNNYDIHQYTSNGRLQGYNSVLDLNRIVKKSFEYFFSKSETTNKEGVFMKNIKIAASGVKLRNSVDISSDKNVIATLKRGDVVSINDIVFANGFVWGVQPRADGSKGYIDIGKSVSWIS